MANHSVEEVFAALEVLLDREKAALIGGDFGELPEIIREKGLLLESLETTRPEKQDRLSAIHDKVRKNQMLLDGALKGVRLVAERMATLRRVSNSLETYDQRGKRTLFDTQSPQKVEKRA